ncbi:hypothetical protein EMPG_12394 [Blastomyces silverae]|uniref:Uncharacterized protein n=1 Tax=Blastomyces silverae TaxID=2060906 RepID=A0A0H1BU40_9EURO|nr:hypothetical protein EMPG_12394 [Blastomyces silverae]
MHWRSIARLARPRISGTYMRSFSSCLPKTRKPYRLSAQGHYQIQRAKKEQKQQFSHSTKLLYSEERIPNQTHTARWADKPEYGFGALWDDESQPVVAIEESLKDDKLKKDKTWGFVVYRCTYSDDDAWEEMLDLICSHMEGYLMMEGGEEFWDRHELIVVDDRTQLDGASSHVVRDHFNRFVQNEMDKLPKLPESEREEEELLRKKIASATRYNFCLFVDDISLESMKHMPEPVIKLLCREWGPLPVQEGEYTVHPDFEDGKTADEKEDVGWRYIYVLSCFEFYDKLHGPGKWALHYERPPYWSCQSIHEVPGFWRRKGEGGTSCSQDSRKP